MEAKRWLATGHARTAHARNRCNRAWAEISVSLNSQREGCLKTRQQWQKYWKDKKGAIKRKCISLARARKSQRIDVEMEDIGDLSHVEQRIVSLLSGKSNVITNSNLKIHIFDSLSAVTDVEEKPLKDPTSPVLDPPHIEEAIEVPVLTSLEEMQVPLTSQSASVQNNTSGHRSDASEDIPSGVSAQSSPNGSKHSGTSTKRRRLLRGSPSQPRSAVATLTERIIAIEERRIDTELLMARSHEMYAQAHKVMAESLSQVAQAWATHAQALNNIAMALSRSNNQLL